VIRHALGRPDPLILHILHDVVVRWQALDMIYKIKKYDFKSREQRAELRTNKFASHGVPFRLAKSSRLSFGLRLSKKECLDPLMRLIKFTIPARRPFLVCVASAIPPALSSVRSTL
jgi:hypothetical protein